MSIPKLRKDGWLPVGIYTCSLSEIEKRFGKFKRTDRRIELFNKLVQLVTDAYRTGFVKEFFIDGSFTSAKDEPGDIDLIIVLDPNIWLDPKYDVTFADEIALDHYRLKKKYKFDVFTGVENSEKYFEYLDKYQQIRDNPDVRKGILRLRL